MFRKFNLSTILLTLSEPKLKILQRIVIGKNRKLKKKIDSGSLTLKFADCFIFVLFFKFASPNVNLRALLL